MSRPPPREGTAVVTKVRCSMSSVRRRRCPTELYQRSRTYDLDASDRAAFVWETVPEYLDGDPPDDDDIEDFAAYVGYEVDDLFRAEIARLRVRDAASGRVSPSSGDGVKNPYRRFDEAD